MKTLKKTVIVAVATLALAGLSGMTHGSNVFANSTGEGSLNVHPITDPNSSPSETKQKAYRYAIKGYKKSIKTILTKNTAEEFVDGTMLEVEELFVKESNDPEVKDITWDKAKHDLEDKVSGQTLKELFDHYQKMRGILDEVNWEAKRPDKIEESNSAS
ncbi:hypothetical protein [Streptococcus halichoeri]|uniref:hypothetical protein n=1 Tax=Streptococcus halichoeri TaxID=254785 RepID=UPI00135BEDEE|nr:hypothetical protein [Streptococcus halichoeri]